MAISIQSVSITSIRSPTVAPVAINIAGGTADHVMGIPMNVKGQVVFGGRLGDPVAGWDVGWVQAEWVETNWAHYRGRTTKDGSVFVQRGRHPARAQQACRDTSGAVGDIFTDPNDPIEFRHLPAGLFPATVRVESNDGPSESYPLIRRNSQTNKDNYLHEVQIEFMFCTVLTVRDTLSNFHHLAHFYWNARWQTKFLPTTFPPTTVAHWKVTAVGGGTGATAGSAIDGRPNDHRFIHVLTTPQVSSCDDLAATANNVTDPAAGANANVREFADWQEVDVRR